MWAYLSPRRRIQLWLLFVVMLVSGGAELVSLGAVLPFLSVLSEPERLWQQSLVQTMALRIGIKSSSELLLPVTLLFVTAAVHAAFVRLANLWLNGRLAAAVGSDLSCEAYRRTLYQPYAVHAQRNSAEVITGTTTHINLTVAALNSFLQLITAVVVSIALLIGLVLIDAKVAISAGVLFGIAYGFLVIVSRRELRRNGQKIAEATRHQLKALQEGLGAIRDVLLDGTQPLYLQTYRQADRPKRQLQAKNVFLGAFPRYALEALGVVSIALLGGLLVLQQGNAVSVIPFLGVLALGAQRLLPALQQIYSCWASLKSYNAAIKSVLEMLNQQLPPILSVAEPLLLREGIRLEGVRFRYEGCQSEVLRGLNLEIFPGERIGLIGTTGSGKSTTVDLLLRLLEPTAGRILVDGCDLHETNHPDRLLSWRAAIAHVPQSIYLSDSSITENIAFGVPRNHINLDQVKQAAERAEISKFIESMSEGYDTFVGEHGIRLSGGQRQRIGIARALYKKAQVLVLDEATSALDVYTEEIVMKAINNLSESLTVIMIAHRLSTMESCDRVIRLEHGSISADGPPHLVLANQPDL